MDGTAVVRIRVAVFLTKLAKKLFPASFRNAGKDSVFTAEAAKSPRRDFRADRGNLDSGHLPPVLWELSRANAH